MFFLLTYHTLCILRSILVIKHIVLFFYFLNNSSLTNFDKTPLFFLFQKNRISQNFKKSGCEHNALVFDFHFLVC